jgi:hypothetical protein
MAEVLDQEVPAFVARIAVSGPLAQTKSPAGTRM